MMWKTPRFWKTRNGYARMLRPAAALYGAAAALHRRIRAARVCPPPPVPVICVGNLTAGGSGKTPAVIALAFLLQKAGHIPHIVTRGYGGSIEDVIRIHPARHTAAEAGDEALLLARVAPCWKAVDRAAGIDAAARNGAELILLDDGFQNPRIPKTCSLAVMDRAYGVGNGWLLPAGPLREPPAAAWARAGGVLFIGDAATPLPTDVAPPASLPAFHAQLAPEVRDWAGDAVVAFAGIGRPEKYFATLEAMGCTLAACRAFADHHPYTDTELLALADLAARHRARLVTTEKDHIRLSESWRGRVDALPVRLVFEAEEAVLEWVRSYMPPVSSSDIPQEASKS